MWHYLLFCGCRREWVLGSLYWRELLQQSIMAQWTYHTRIIGWSSLTEMLSLCINKCRFVSWHIIRDHSGRAKIRLKRTVRHEQSKSVPDKQAWKACQYPPAYRLNLFSSGLHWSQGWQNLDQNWLKLANWLRRMIPDYYSPRVCFLSASRARLMREQAEWSHSFSFMFPDQPCTRAYMSKRRILVNVLPAFTFTFVYA